MDLLKEGARDFATTIDKGHANLGGTATPLLDEIAIEGVTEIATFGLGIGAKMGFRMGAKMGVKIGLEMAETGFDTARKIDDKTADAIAKALNSIENADELPLVRGVDNADGVPLEKVVGEAQKSVAVSKKITVTGTSQDVSQIRSLLHQDDSLVRFGAKVKPLRGVTDVISHADEMGFQGVVGRELVEVSPVDLAAYLQLHGKADGPIRLIACSAGKYDAGAASQVARHLGVRVRAATDVVDVLEDGSMVIRNNGRWRWFGPDGNPLD